VNDSSESTAAWSPRSSALRSAISASDSAKAEHVEIAPKALRVARLGDRHEPLLHVPAQHDLRGRPAVRRGELGHERDRQRVDVAATERRPRLREDTVRGVEGARCRSRHERVQLDLVDVRHQSGLVHQPSQMRRLKIRRTDEILDDLLGRQEPVGLGLAMPAHLVEYEPFAATNEIKMTGHRRVHRSDLALDDILCRMRNGAPGRRLDRLKTGTIGLCADPAGETRSTRRSRRTSG
jgi:hypothetical protein